jgi:5-methylcytosine-specific restriction endonuclease McrA
MPTKLAQLRAKAYARQQGRCFYCRQPMWVTDDRSFAARYHLTARQARVFRCTAEHLIARQDGGGDTEDNIAAACHYCNWGRHARKRVKDSSSFTAFVQRRMARGGWQMRLPAVLQQPAR